MCAVFGFLDYGKKVNHKILVKLLNELAKAAEIRGTDATGISYVNNGNIVTYKTPKPAHKVNLYFPKETTAVIGHTRMTTQGSENKNYNNHPFEGKCDTETFALAHNGVLYNDKELRVKNNIPETEIETDSYIAVQLLEQNENVDTDSIKKMAEAVEGSFVFTILRNDNMMFLVKGSNPLTIYHYKELGLYVYASTIDILKKGLKSSGFKIQCNEVIVEEGNIIKIEPNGEIWSSDFEMRETERLFSRWYNFDWYSDMEEDCFDELKSICSYYGVSEEQIEYMRSLGYTYDEIEEMMFDMEFADENKMEYETNC